MKTVAIPYAKSLLSLANSRKEVTDFMAQLSSVQSYVTALNEYTILDKTQLTLIMQELSISKPISTFLQILLQANRIDTINYIVTALEELWNAKNKVQKIIITSAVKLSKDGEKKLTDFLVQKYEKVSIEFKVDKGIIGGLVVSMPDKQVDFSTKSKLQQLHQVL